VRQDSFDWMKPKDDFFGAQLFPVRPNGFYIRENPGGDNLKKTKNAYPPPS
jgi:hypothetical protein